jgi:site-specific recombinase XerD
MSETVPSPEEKQYPVTRIGSSMEGELLPARPSPPTLAPATRWERVLESYLRSLDSDATRRSYKRHLEVALDALRVATLAELTGEMLLDWRAHVTASGLAPATQSQALAALRSFLKWSGALGAHGLPDAIISKTLPSPRATVRKPYQVLSEPECARLLAAAQTPRDRALVSLLLGAGLRAGELVALDVSDVRESDDGEATIYIRLGKGRKDRQVPIRTEVARCIRSYLASSGRTLGGDGPLLLSADRARRRADRRLSARAVGYLLERLCEDAAIDAKKISPHSLRHGYALRALRQGARCRCSRSSSVTRVSPRPPSTSTISTSPSSVRRCRPCQARLRPKSPTWATCGRTN